MKIKVKELIEKYDIPRKETLEILSELGIEVKTVSSSISSSDAERFAEKIKGSKSPKKGSEKKEKKPKKAATKEPKRANSIIGNENKPVGTLEMTVMQFDANLTKEPPKEKKKSSDDEAKKTVVADKTETKKEDIKAKASKTEAKPQPAKEDTKSKAKKEPEVEVIKAETKKKESKEAAKPKPEMKKDDNLRAADEKKPKKAPKEDRASHSEKRESSHDATVPARQSKFSDKKRTKKRGGKRRDERFSKFDRAESIRGQIDLEKRKKKKKIKKQVPKAEEQEEEQEELLPVGTKKVNVPITVAGLSEQIDYPASKIIMALMKIGILANLNQTLDEETVLVLSDEIGINIVIGNVEKEVEDEGLESFEDKEEDLISRPPIVTVMGHVDHGKTSLLDAIRRTNVIESESGGITQHIGASEVEVNGEKIVFLDTPGHEAFTAMRARGAHVTDIAVLVVAADDSVKPQTIESINHAKAAKVPIIVAINKMDKPGADPDKVKADLMNHGLVPEDFGGDIICVQVSAKKGEGIKDLLEMILLQAEVLELRANPNRLALGNVIEAKLDKSKGAIATLLVMNGTLKVGMSVVAGTASGKIRSMVSANGKKLHKAVPGMAVEVLGFTDVPHAGDEFNALKNDKKAKEIAENRKEKLRGELMATKSTSSLEEFFGKLQAGDTKQLNLIVKADVQGSVGAIVTSVEKLSNEDVTVKVIHRGVGAVSESDLMLAETSGAIIIGFNVRPSQSVLKTADSKGIEIRTYRVIYDIIDDIENAMKGMLEPVTVEKVLGTAVIREIFNLSNAGTIGGAYVTDGKIVRNESIRLVRDGIVVHEGKLASLKRFKDDAREVSAGFECGIGLEDYNDIKPDDEIECYTTENKESE